jgi:hypothetical protein
MFGQLVALIEKVDDASPVDHQKPSGSETEIDRGETDATNNESVHSKKKAEPGTSRTDMIEVVKGSAPTGLSPSSAVRSTGASSSSSSTYWGGIAITVPDQEVQRMSGSPVKRSGDATDQEGRYGIDDVGYHAADPQGGSIETGVPGSLSAAIKSLAVAQTKISRLEREKAFLAKELQAAQEALQQQGALLEQMGSSAAYGSSSSPAPQRSIGSVNGSGGGGEDEVKGTAMDPDELHFEVSSAVERYRQEQVLRLESLVQFHLVTIAALEESNSQLRSELLQCEIDLQFKMAESRSKGEQLAQLGSTADEATRNLSKKTTEIQSLTLRLGKMATALQQKDAESGVLREEVDSLSKKLIERENEIEQMRESNLGMEEVKEIRMFKALDQSPSVWGKGITRAATVLDRLSLKTGTFLKSNARIRLIIALYVILLHLYVFHVVTSVVHVMPHSAEDAHDHLANHIHPGNGT